MSQLKEQLTTQNVIIGLLTLAVIYLMYVNYNRNCDEKYGNIKSEYKVSTGFVDLIQGNTNPTVAGGVDLVYTDNNGNLSKYSSIPLVPSGTIVAFNGSTVPTGWVLCDGTKYDRVTGLSVTATTSVSGNIVQAPDLRGRFILAAGAGTGLTSRTLGGTGGAETHTLSIDEMPAHDHSYNTHTHYSSIYGGFSGGSNRQSLDNGISTGSKGGSQPHNNMPPFYVLTYIMKL
jgi:microcystin-dependent protein